MKTHIMIFGKLNRTEDREIFEATCIDVFHTIHAQTRGIIRSELVRDTHDPDVYVLLSQWENQDAWAVWQRSPEREEQVRPLSQYWTGHGKMRICETIFQLGSD